MAATAAVSATAVVAGALGLAAAAGHDPDPGHSGHGLWNDFYSYWGAGRVLNQGGNPYDQDQLRAAYEAGGVHPLVGSGYSYPLFFAQLMRPLALLPPGVAAVVFAAFSAVALGLAVALLLGSMPGLSPGGGLLWGAGIGLAPPVAGSLYVGQVNLIVLLLLALAFRRLATGPVLALAGAIKLFPVAGLLALLGRGGRAMGELAGGLAILLTLLVVPGLLPPHASFGARFAELVAPDAYWTNVSLNGWLSRLLPRDAHSQPALGNIPVGALMGGGLMVAGVAVLGILWRARHGPWQLSLGLALLFGVIMAPKNSIWNDVPLTLCVVGMWPLLPDRPLLRRGTVAAAGLISAGSVGVFVTLLPGPPAAVTTMLSSLTLVGALLLSAVVMRALLTPSGRPHAEADHWRTRGRRSRALLPARR